jgi:hypothetical protein
VPYNASLVLLRACHGAMTFTLAIDIRALVQRTLPARQQQQIVMRHRAKYALEYSSAAGHSDALLLLVT